MATTTMATAAGTIVLLYYVLSRSLSSAAGKEMDTGGDISKSKSQSVKKRLVSRPAQAPATWLETISTLSETLRFMYSETLGKWPIGDLAFLINYLIRSQGNLQVASVYGGENCLQLKGPEIIDQLYHYLRLLTLCILFSNKPFQVFLGSAGYSDVDVLLQKPKAGLLKPAFTILRDENLKCFLLLIRGTHSMKDTLTAATAAVVPFHHSVLHDGGISNLILGYAHCGMVAAARWIAKLGIPSLCKALEQNPDYKVKIVGHSLGGGTAGLLTYILREQKELSLTTCVTFGPAACMTWELAESGKHFITTIVNESDLVPTFSAASVDDLRSEVTASSWLNDLRDQIEQNGVLNVVYCSATTLGSHLPSIANAKARVAGAGSLLRPVSSSTQVVMKRAQDVAQAVVKTRSSISSWTSMGLRRRAVVHSSNSKVDDLTEVSLHSEKTSESLVSKVITGESRQYETDEEEGLIKVDEVVAASTLEEITEGELWCELKKELQRQEDQFQDEEEVAFVDDLRSEVTTSSWLNNLRYQVEQNRVLNVVYCSATALGSYLPSITNAKAWVAGAGALIRPVSRSTQVVMKRAQDVAQAVDRTPSSISSWTSMGLRHRAVVHSSNSKSDDLTEASLRTEKTSESLVSEVITSESRQYETDEEEDRIQVDEVAAASTLEEITEGELWYELKKELQRQEDQIQDEEEAAIKEITEEEKVLTNIVESQRPIFSSYVSDNHHFYPPGSIMHIVSVHSPEGSKTGQGGRAEEQICLYQAPRELYSKLRLSKTMINDHYMLTYKKMMELLIEQLENDLRF